MTIVKILGYLGGYFNATEYELDIPKIADISESSEDEVNVELQKLQSNGDIDICDNKITLIKISPKNNKKFNELYSPVETLILGKNSMLKLDK